MLLEGVRNAYEVGRLVAATKTYRLYLAKIQGMNDRCLLQVARNLESNGGLSRAAYVLGELADTSRRYDELYAKKNKGKRLHYDRLFPAVAESFVSNAQGGRHINVLTFTDVGDVATLLPLSNLRTKDQVILDLKSGAWVMGRLIKLLDFVHSQRIAIRSIRPNNILLEKDQHFAVVLDWSNAFVFQDTVSSEAATADLVRAAEAVLTSCGMEGKELPYQLADGDERLVALLRNLADGAESSADRAHTQFYEICHTIWGTGFHPFTTLPLP